LEKQIKSDKLRSGYQVVGQKLLLLAAPGNLADDRFRNVLEELRALEEVLHDDLTL
jgi:hypothetical protein